MKKLKMKLNLFYEKNNMKIILIIITILLFIQSLIRRENNIIEFREQIKLCENKWWKYWKKTEWDWWKNNVCIFTEWKKIKKVYFSDLKYIND